MAVVGLIGGIAPESTVDYYRSMVALYRERRGADHYPRILINSVNLSTLVELVTTGRLDDLTSFLLDELGRLKRAGADFGLLASNTPHIVFDRVSAQSPIPLLSIVEATAEAASAGGFRTVGLFGTRFTMEGGFYASVLARFGIHLVLPNPEERDFVHSKYMGELIQGQFRPDTRNAFEALIRTLHVRDAVEAIILGGTELPLLLRDATDLPCPLLDTTAIHVESAVRRLLQLEGAA